ncbi:MAG: glucose 1-dehydrogenase [Synergistaceae bacterium]|jgi:NAD(P)-dependent dehydrogenase (short-subunit alcohol dehydrogenase family)|nr:glucose 1-dehydrogenase [Synergistaceae bacterium]
MNVLEKYSLAGRVAVVTGASQGLGRGYAAGLAEAGAVVVCCARSVEGLRSAAVEIAAKGGRAEAVALDVTRYEETGKIFEKIRDKYGSLDILVNNAGTEEVADFVDVTPEQYDKIMDVNLKGAFFTAQAAARIMKTRKKGKILNIGSLGSAIGLSGSSVYCGTKGGVLQMTRAMAIELAPYNIQVNALGPGYFRTPMTEPFFQDPAHRKWIEERIPAGRAGTVEDLLGAVIFLCGDASGYLTGQILYVDGGWLAS